MCPILRKHSLAEHYDQNLRLAHGCLPADAPSPQPTCHWPKENIALLERYRDWLLGGGASQLVTNMYYVPMAGHVFGLTLKPYRQLNPDTDLACALDYIKAKGLGKNWIKNCRNALAMFRRFLRLERGLGEEKRGRPFDVAAHTVGLPAWLVSELERYQRLQERNWRVARLDENIVHFWSGYLRIWRFLVEHGAQTISELKRQHILDYVDARLSAGYAVSGVNGDMRNLHCFLLFLQDEGYAVAQALLRIPGLKQPDVLPKYLTDEQVQKLRGEIERRVDAAALPSYRRQALLTRAAFYLLWQCGLRLGEVEELRLEDLDFPAKKLTVRDGKGRKDRAVYLAPNAILALQSYLAVRGTGASDIPSGHDVIPMNLGDHVFLYRNAPLKKDIIRAHLKDAGESVGVKVYPHRLRHTCATQLLNAGCRVTSIQAFLGHKKLSTTMIYARAHDQTVAADYFAAMQRVEQRLDPIPPKPEPETPNVDAVPEPAQVFTWLEKLAQPELDFPARLEIAEGLRRALALTLARQHSPPMVVLV